MCCRLWKASSAMHRLVVLTLTLVVGVLLTVPSPVYGQAANGTLLGNVRDDSGAAVPGTTVTATEVQTNVARSAVSNDTGFYTFTNLPPGVYRVEGELQGFKKFVREGVEVRVNTTVRVDVALSVGALTESVTVAGETPLLQTDRTDTGRIIEGEQIAQMPLGFNRNFQGMLITVPGAGRPFRPHSEFFNSQDSLSTNVNGQSRLSNNVQLEGIDNNHKTGLLTVLIPNAEALETVAVTTSNYDAEFGRAGGAVTNVTLKSGTNEYKGSAFAFGNTDATIARNAFSTLSEAARHDLSPGGLHAGRPDHPQQAVLLRRLHADRGRQRPHHARHAARGAVPDRRLQLGANDHLRPGHRQPGWHRPHAVPQQSDPGGAAQPDRATPARQRAAAQHLRRAARHDQLRAALRAREAHQPV